MTTSTRPSWREEIRQDRLMNAQIERDRETARVQARIAERQAATRLRRADQLARAAARQQALAHSARNAAPPGRRGSASTRSICCSCL